MLVFFGTLKYYKNNLIDRFANRTCSESFVHL